MCDKNECSLKSALWGTNTPPPHTDMSLGLSDVELSSTEMKGVMSAE